MPRYNANFTSDSEKQKYLFCNGSTYDTDKYPKLYAVLGTNKLPNLNNRVLWGNTTGGTYKEAGLPNITGTFATELENRGLLKYSGAFGFSHFFGYGDEGVAENESLIYTFDASKSNAIYGKSSTVQPPAMTVRFYIRAK